MGIGMVSIHGTNCFEMGQFEGRPKEKQDHQDEDLSNNEKSLVHTQQLSVDQKEQLSPLQSEELVIMQISHALFFLLF